MKGETLVMHAKWQNDTFVELFETLLSTKRCFIPMEIRYGRMNTGCDGELYIEARNHSQSFWIQDEMKFQ